MICVVNNPGESLIGTIASAGIAAPKLRVLHVANIDGVVGLSICQQGKELVRVTSDPEEEQTDPPSIER